MNNETTQTSIAVEFTTDRLHIFQERWAKASKKFAKVGQELRIVSQKEVVRTEDRKVGDRTFKVDVSYTILEIARPDITVRPGVEFWGTINIEQGVKTVYRTEACPDDLVLANLELKCDHCNSNRRRKAYFIFGENGQTLRLGSTCCQPYFGLDLARILKVYDGIMEMVGDPIPEGYGRGDNGIDLGDLILVTEFCTAQSGWVPASQRMSRETSGDAIRHLLGILENGAYNEREKHTRERFVEFCKGQSEEKIQEVRNLLISQFSKPENDFGWNIYNALFADNELEELRMVNRVGEKGDIRLVNRIATKTLGIVGYAIHSAIFGDPRKKWENKEEKTDEKKSEKVGNKGDRITVEVTVTDVRALENQWGDSLMIGFEDNSGNSFRWFYSGRDQGTMKRDMEAAQDAGKVVRIKGTVKKHDEYRGKAQTHLTRCAVL